MIYLHIPFCKKKCSYCNFHFSTSLRMKDEMLTSMKKEIGLRNHELPNKTIDSLYFGGGTPSVLSINEIQSLMDEVLRFFTFDKSIEITLEANPDDLNKEFLTQLRGTDINRLSIGTQSFFDEDLRLMNRAHNAQQAEESIKRAQDFGFENINVDLIYGSPSSSLDSWKKNLQKIIDLQIPHVSSYALTIEPKTAFYQWILKNKISAPKDFDQSQAFFYMSEFLQDQGFDHYEISNFGKPQSYSKHNTAYWKYAAYLGIGPSAHSYNGKDLRSWNPANNTHYIKTLSENRLPRKEEILSENEQYNEMLMIGLRTSFGIDLNKIEDRFNSVLIQKSLLSIKQKLDDGLLIVENNHLKIPKKHWFFADGIAADLFILDR